MPEDLTPARQDVEAEIRANGPITFARFMEIALYGEHGYYTSNVKAGADYATSPQMHPAFGALMAGYLFRAWVALGAPDVFDVVEIGAGDGGLARDVLDAVSGSRAELAMSEHAHRFVGALRYHPFDVRPRGEVLGVGNLSELHSVVGCVISNELLDAFPVHVFTVREGGVLECYVGIDDDGDLFFVEGEVSCDEILYRVGRISTKLPDGYRGEVNLGIKGWAESVGEVLERGYVLTIDYGHEQEMLYHPARYEGSLRCYRDHVLGQNPFRDVGLQDMTAQVDFTAVGDELRRVGLVEESPLRTQRDFLIDLGFGEYTRQVRRQLAGNREVGDGHRLTSELRGLNALVDPRGLGGFMVAQYGISAPSLDLSGLDTVPLFSLPVSRPRHLSHVSYD